MSQQPESAVVVGGGIGGLSSALALARRGVQAVVLEAVSKFAEVGAGIQLAPNATRILAELGVMEQVERTAVYPENLVFRSAKSGQVLITLDLGEPFRQRYGAPYIVMHRHDLLEALLDGCQEHPLVTLETEKKVVELEEGPSGVRVHCEDGSEYRTSLVVGADGLHSQLRRRVSAEGGPVPTPRVSYRGTVPFDAIEGDEAQHDVVAWIGPDVDYVRYPLRRHELYNQVASFSSHEFDPSTQDWGGPEELDRRFAFACPAVQRGMALIDRERRWFLNDGEPLRRWTLDRLALVGDAAHPMWQYLAQGGCQALEDASALAQSVATHSNVPDGLADYEQVRAPAAGRVQSSAKVWGQMWHFDGAAAAVRDEFFKTIGPTDYERLDWLYRPLTAPVETTA